MAPALTNVPESGPGATEKDPFNQLPGGQKTRTDCAWGTEGVWVEITVNRGLWKRQNHSVPLRLA